LLDKSKNAEIWQRILFRQVPGQIKNVYTKRDMILLFYSFAEKGWSLGRNAIFEKNSDKHRNFVYDEGDELLVEKQDLNTFRLLNYNLWSLASDDIGGIGHTNYR
jgi:hypothetical protein